MPFINTWWVLKCQERAEEEHEEWLERYKSGKLTYGSEKEIARQKKKADLWYRILLVLTAIGIVMVVGAVVWSHEIVNNAPRWYFNAMPIFACFYFVALVSVALKSKAENDWYYDLKNGF